MKIVAIVLMVLIFIGTVYFLMSEDIVKKQIALPYMSFGSDAGSMAPVEPFTNSNPHPRAYPATEPFGFSALQFCSKDQAGNFLFSTT